MIAWAGIGTLLLLFGSVPRGPLRSPRAGGVPWTEAAPQEREPVVPAPSMCKVRGRVHCAGHGLPDVFVGIVPWREEPVSSDGSPRSTHEARTDSGGLFEIRDVPPGPATVYVGLGGARGPLYFHLARIPGEPEFVLDTPVGNGEISGRVIRGSDGAPLAGWTITAWPSDSTLGARKSGTAATAETDSEGRYRVRNLKPGSYRVSVSTTGRVGDVDLACKARGPVEVRGELPAVVDFLLSAGGTARVRVFDPEGEPVETSGEPFLFLAEKPGAPPSPAGFARAERERGGQFRARGLPPGTYVAMATGPGGSWTRSEVKAVRPGEETKFRVDLKRGVPVAVDVRDEDDLPVSPRLLVGVPALVDGEGYAIPVFPVDPGTTDTDRLRAGVNQFASGDYSVRLRLEGFRELSVPLRVGSESPPTVVLRLEREPKAR